MYTVPIGRAALRRRGSDLTIVATSFASTEACRASEVLSEQGLEAEVIDLRSVKPWDQDAVCTSVERTGRLLVVDAAWKTCGVAAEIAATVGRELFNKLRTPILRLCLADVPAPTSAVLEKAYYIGSEKIVSAARECCGVGLQQETACLADLNTLPKGS